MAGSPQSTDTGFSTTPKVIIKIKQIISPKNPNNNI
jgi:hypothetical protein